MWFWGSKNKTADRQDGPQTDSSPWKEKYMNLLVALGDMYPYGMIQLLSEVGEERELRWDWTDWNQTIQRHQSYIYNNINRIRSLDKIAFPVHGQMTSDLPIPSIVLNNVVKVRSMVNGWERTQRLGLPFFALADYIPARIKKTDEDSWNIRNLIWHFKCDIDRTTSHQHANAIQTICDRISDVLCRTFGDELKGLTLVCIPASSTVTNDVRYAEFAARLCLATGMTNGHGHFQIIGKKTPKHIGKSEGVKVELDTDWFRYRKILFFDDIITTGSGYEFMTGLMKEARAFVIGAVFIGQTVCTNEGTEKEQ